eukprot:TRINITY_DN3106_c0_g1_i1.p1 TRINITY_DN3106_c0_g1~~TRINITY_DN3106_c0_g1_i1.p1  ORF type:complete len:317 (+),score=20.55 TRINITY_DN3106_c0_g1_i1:90-1040(+)
MDMHDDYDFEQEFPQCTMHGKIKCQTTTDSCASHVLTTFYSRKCMMMAMMGNNNQTQEGPPGGGGVVEMKPEELVVRLPQCLRVANGVENESPFCYWRKLCDMEPNSQTGAIPFQVKPGKLNEALVASGPVAVTFNTNSGWWVHVANKLKIPYTYQPNPHPPILHGAMAVGYGHQQGTGRQYVIIRNTACTHEPTIGLDKYRVWQDQLQGQYGAPLYVDPTKASSTSTFDKLPLVEPPPASYLVPPPPLLSGQLSIEEEMRLFPDVAKELIPNWDLYEVFAENDKLRAEVVQLQQELRSLKGQTKGQQAAGGKAAQ